MYIHFYSKSQYECYAEFKMLILDQKIILFCLNFQIRIKNTHDNMSWDRLTCFHGFTLDNRKLDTKTMREVSKNNIFCSQKLTYKKISKHVIFSEVKYMRIEVFILVCLCVLS